MWTSVRRSQINKSRISVLELRQVRFRREIKRQLQVRVSFLQGEHLFHFSFIPCRSLTAFSVGWTHSVRHGTVEGRFLNKNRQIKLKSNVKEMPPTWYFYIWQKCPTYREKTLKTNLTSSCFQDAGKSLSPTSSPLARSWQEHRKACAVSMSRNLTAASCKSRRFVSSLFSHWPQTKARFNNFLSENLVYLTSSLMLWWTTF